MDYIVLTKYVPDTSKIPENAWDKERGTLKRNMLEMVCNPLDKNALEFALQMREKNNSSESRIVALTMGPPNAEEVLKYALSLGADSGVLLTDRKFAGADTIATAYSLAQAIRRIEKEVLKTKDYIILAGMQSIDGDTAQVPAQIAEELGIPQVAYCTDFRIDDGGVEFQRITSDGLETLAPKSCPCVLTVTNCNNPRYMTLRGAVKARRAELLVWDSNAVEAAEELIGLTGSKTRVVKIFTPKEIEESSCRMIKPEESGIEDFVREIAEQYQSEVVESGGGEDVGVKYVVGPDGTSKEGEVWVYAEQENNVVHPAVYEIISKLNEFSEILGEKVGAVLVGGNVKDQARDLIRYGADKVYVVENEKLEDFSVLGYTKAVTELIHENTPQIMLFAATPVGRELGPRIAYRVKSGVTADCTKLEIGDFKLGKEEYRGILLQTRPALGGNIMATIVSVDSQPQIATVQPGLLEKLEPDPRRDGEVVEHETEVTGEELGTTIKSKAKAETEAIDIENSAIIVCGGAGLCTKTSFNENLGLLADALSEQLGEEALVGATRKAVESDWIGHDHLIGQTGKSVAPKLYIAVGVSGAIQHITGISKAKTVVAVNKDPHAPIFRKADYGIVGDATEIIPLLVKALKKKE